MDSTVVGPTSCLYKPHYESSGHAEPRLSGSFLWQGRAILVDGTHGTNKYKFCLTTIIVIDEHNKAIPVAFFIHSRQSDDVLAAFFDTLAEKAQPGLLPVRRDRRRR